MILQTVAKKQANKYPIWSKLLNNTKKEEKRENSKTFDDWGIIPLFFWESPNIEVPFYLIKKNHGVIS